MRTTWPVLPCIQCGGTHCYPSGHAKRIAELEDECARYREALERLLSVDHWDESVFEKHLRYGRLALSKEAA